MKARLAHEHLRPGGRLVAHHMSHSGNPTHEKVEAILGPHGVEVAYDGLDIRLWAKPWHTRARNAVVRERTRRLPASRIDRLQGPRTQRTWQAVVLALSRRVPR
jgi:hypothetical protein